MEFADIQPALEDIQEVLEAEHAALEAQLQAALSARTYDVLKQLTPRIEAIEAFRARVVALNGDWQKSFAKKQRNTERSGRVIRTREAAFNKPILEALVNRGGKAHIRVVLGDLETRMGTSFTEHDVLPIPSDPSQLRWQNTATWARHDLRLAGRIKDDSPQGIWEISDAGREWVKEG
jgi:restriction system protein